MRGRDLALVRAGQLPVEHGGLAADVHALGAMRAREHERRDGVVRAPELKSVHAPHGEVGALAGLERAEILPPQHLRAPALADEVARVLRPAGHYLVNVVDQPPWEALGAEHVLIDDETRRLRTRGKSTPDLLKARAGDLADAPDAVVRPGSHEDVEAVLAWAVDHARPAAQRPGPAAA